MGALIARGRSTRIGSVMVYWIRCATIAVFLLLPACAPREVEVPQGSRERTFADPAQITILHTNDIHGQFRGLVQEASHGNEPVGGFVNLSAHVRRERALNERTLLLDAGDVMTGNPICEYEYEGVRGGALFHLMNLIGYDAMALGHTEFDLGPRNLDGLLGLADFPVLSINTQRYDGSPVAHDRFRIFELDSLRVGVIGLMTEELSHVVARARLAGTHATPAIAAAREAVAELRQVVDLVVLVTHSGVEADRALARQVEGIDVIVGGHSHRELAQPLVENGVLIVQAGAHGRNLGRLTLTIENGGVTAYHGELIPLLPIDGADPDVEREVETFSTLIEHNYGRVIGQLATPWRQSRSTESNVGNWICDRLRESADADFAIYNSGGIRKDVAAGPVTRLDVFELLPFANLVATFECSGEELKLMLETNAKAALSGEHSVLQVSGIRYSYAPSGDGVVVSNATVRGASVNRFARYKGITVDYVIFSNPQRYLGFDPTVKKTEYTLFSNFIVRAVEESHRAIEARIDGRMQFLPATAPEP